MRVRVFLGVCCLRMSVLGSVCVCVQGGCVRACVCVSVVERACVLLGWVCSVIGICAECGIFEVVS